MRVNARIPLSRFRLGAPAFGSSLSRTLEHGAHLPALTDSGCWIALSSEESVSERFVLFVGMTGTGTEDGGAVIAFAIFGLEERHVVERGLYPGSLSAAFRAVS